ncbi:mitogen-activated protein kinase-binding protein 1 isoform X4 [Chironomus tepperi]|uniref:mitogen-activated protein kinase-binding protein 1 isoform X4 n=1 Tax=Chironomus tepperi TaxID=113505 RepID=UPI00391FBF15
MFAPRNSSPPMSYFTNHHDDLAAYQIKLKKIIGLTVCSSAGLDSSPTTGVIAYPAGCAVVLFNSKKLSQTYLLNTSRKAITAVSYSQCGRYLATGECGINPTIKVWELELSPGNESNVGGTVIAEFSGHKYAVNCVAFSPTGKYLVSVGSQHDNIVNVFDWKSNLKIASNKVSAKVVAVSFSEDGNYFVTVGNRHVKYWYLEGGRKYKEPIPLMGRSAILGELRNNDFCAVACGKGDMIDSTYAITRNGHLVEFNSRRLLDKWVMCRTTSANCMVASAKLIFVGCADAIIRVFNTETLEYVTTLPRTHYLGVDVAQGVQISHMMSAPQNSKYPDTIAIVFDETRSKVSCVYNDHSLYIWDLRDIRRVGKSHSFLYHSACIWGVETVPSNFLKNGNVQCKLPPDSFLTCSSDDTIRVWGLEQCEANEIYRKNIYSKELLKVIYIDDDMNFIKDMDNPTQSNEKSSSYDGRNGVRCIKVSADYGQLATGDRSGNIRIYNLNTLKLITSIEAHDSEVLCLEYTNDKIDRKLLASASRDRLIHVFDVENGYRILQTLDDHSSSITSVKFIGSGLQFQMISCGADKSIIFRNYQNNQFTRGNNCSAKNTLYDMEVDSTAKHILTACQDRNIRVYGTQNAKHTKTFKGSHSDEGTLIKLSLDLSGIYIATSCTDKTLSVYDYYSGECMAKMYGHSELVTGLKFTNDCKHLISASGDGCIFIWQVPHDMIVTMQARLSQQAMRSGQQPSIPRQLTTNPFSDSPIDQQNYSEKFGSPPAHFLNDETSPTYKLSEVGQLPMWAKRKPDESTPIIMGSSPNQNQPQINQKPRGKWAQRGQFDAETLDLRNIVDTPNQTTTNIMLSNNTPTSGYNSGGSKDVYSNYLSEDSSIDSGMENRRENPFMAPKVVLEHNKMHSLNSESNTEHDGDVEDISDGERTSSDHGMIYYPTPHSNTPTDFKVNEMKEDELRKSIRRSKLEKQGLSVSQIIAVTASNTGTNTSDDEDDASTPSGDNAERSLASTLGGSSESIPHPSTFLQVALDGPGSLSDHSKDKEKSRKSISAMHNIDNKTTSLSKSYTNSKKEELLKVINEAKQKLENVGYKSSLRASQSISDLSHANIDARTRLLRGAGGNKSFVPDNDDCGDENESSIRRACSLSDLSMGKGFKSTATSPKTKDRNASRNLPKRSASSVGKSATSGMGMRSASVGMLNQASDSDQSEPIASRGGVLRPTISSNNKVNGNIKYINPRSAAGIISRRKGMQNSYSSVNLTTTGQDESSSEESPPPNIITSPTKPAVPPRPRNIQTQDQRRITNINTMLNSKKLELAAGMMEMPCKDSDIENADINTQFCSNVINQLMNTANAVLQLHQRLRSVDEPTSTGNNNLMLKELENAVIMTQSVLTKITARNADSSPENSTNGNLNQDRLNNNHNIQSNGEYIQMIDKCSDLLNKVQIQKHVNNNSN